MTKSGAPDVGVTLVFQDATGAVVSTAVTRADGKATAQVVDGSQITIAFGVAGSRSLVTYVGVKRGDVINVAEKVTRDVQVTQTTFAMGGSDTIFVGNYNCSTNALSTGNVVLISASPDCVSGSAFPVISERVETPALPAPGTIRITTIHAGVG